MKPLAATIISASVLTLAGLVGYFLDPQNRSEELIPVVFGLLFFAALPSIRQDNRIVEFILRLLLLLLSIALILSLLRALNESAYGRVFRLSLMVGTTLFAFAIYLIEFRKRRLARRKKRKKRK